MSKHVAKQDPNKVKAEFIAQILNDIDPDFTTAVTAQQKGYTVQGPFPSLLIAVGQDQPDGFLISVNADPVSMYLVVSKLLERVPELVNLGAFCENIDGPGIVFGADAYALKEQHVVMQAMSIIQNRKILDPKESKLVLPEKKLVVVK